MKRLAWSFALLLSLPALAGEITIRPGSEVVVSSNEDTVVRCQAETIREYCVCSQDSDDKWNVKRIRNLKDVNMVDVLWIATSAEENDEVSCNMHMSLHKFCAQ